MLEWLGPNSEMSQNCTELRSDRAEQSFGPIFIIHNGVEPIAELTLQILPQYRQLSACMNPERDNTIQAPYSSQICHGHSEKHTSFAIHSQVSTQLTC